MLGDIVDGESIFRGHGRSIDTPTAKQAFGTAEKLISDFIIPIFNTFGIPLSIRGVPGNHGRAIGKPGEAHHLTNWDYVLYEHLSARLGHIEDIEVLISDSNIMLYDVPETPNWRHMLMHGSGIRSWAGIPHYGIDRACMRLQNLMGMPIHYIHLGHFHQGSLMDMPRGEKLLSGSFCGVTEFAVDQLHTGSSAKQSIYGFNNRYGRTWHWDVQLAPLETLKASDRGIYTPISPSYANTPIVVKKKRNF